MTVQESELTSYVSPISFERRERLLTVFNLTVEDEVPMCVEVTVQTGFSLKFGLAELTRKTLDLLRRFF